MSSTNKTANYNLTQFIGSDKPAWLVDYNGDMAAIDAQMKVNADAAAAAQSTANGADGKADANATAISSLNTQINGASGIADDLTSVQGAVNTINSLIGNGEPTTTDKTIIGAINELDSDTGSLATVVSGISTKLSTNYLVAGMKEINITGTFSTIADEITAMKSAIEALLAGLSSDEFIEITAIQLGGFGYVEIGDIWTLNAGSSVASRNISRVFGNASTVYINSGKIDFATPANSILNEVTIAMSDGTVSAAATPVSRASGSSNKVYYTKYVK